MALQTKSFSANFENGKRFQIVVDIFIQQFHIYSVSKHFLVKPNDKEAKKSLIIINGLDYYIPGHFLSFLPQLILHCLVPFSSSFFCGKMPQHSVCGFGTISQWEILLKLQNVLRWSVVWFEFVLQNKQQGRWSGFMVVCWENFMKKAKKILNSKLQKDKEDGCPEEQFTKVRMTQTALRPFVYFLLR